MEYVMHIALFILTVWWAVIVLLWIIAMFYIIWILSKINYMLWDIKDKYNLFTWFIFKPLDIIMHFINKNSK